jgi:5-formyltetrahydrofolate cyclo-ligase
MKTMDKSGLRESYCGVREALPADTVAQQSTAISRRLGRMAVLRHAETVMAYLAFKNELDLSLLFDLLPRITWVLPRIEGRDMVLHPYEPDRLVRHPFGMLEPREDAPVIDPQALDVVLVPGVSFDRRGGRLGFGGGFYDRFLVRTSAIRIGICHDCCLADGVPMDAHDERMDWVVTPTVAIHTAPLWRRGRARLEQRPFVPTLPSTP